MHHYQQSRLLKRAQKNSVAAAKRYISILHHAESINPEQQAILASAHYTLALQSNISPHRSKMHLNSAITLLQNIPELEKLQSPKWFLLLANVYTKRAEQLEYDHEFSMAMNDYQKAFAIFKKLPLPLSNTDKLQFAQCAISIADLVVNTDEFEAEKKGMKGGKQGDGRIIPFSTSSFLHPLSYINIALEKLLELNHSGEEIWTTLSYAHQIAGIALISIDPIEAVEAFRTAIFMAFKATPNAAGRLLGDIYNSIGLLYEQQLESPSIVNLPQSLKDNALIYFAMGLLFSPSEPLPPDESHRLVDYIFDIIYRVLDPFTAPLASTVIQDFIDALIFAYYSISDKSLPNEELYQQFKEPELFNSFAQHIFWLVLEYDKRSGGQGRLLELIDPKEVDLSPDSLDIELALLNPNAKNKVRYLFEETV